MHLRVQNVSVIKYTPFNILIDLTGLLVNDSSLRLIENRYTVWWKPNLFTIICKICQLTEWSSPSAILISPAPENDPLTWKVSPVWPCWDLCCSAVWMSTNAVLSPLTALGRYARMTMHKTREKVFLFWYLRKRKQICRKIHPNPGILVYLAAGSLLRYKHFGRWHFKPVATYIIYLSVFFVNVMLISTIFP